MIFLAYLTLVNQSFQFGAFDRGFAEGWDSVPEGAFVVIPLKSISGGVEVEDAVLVAPEVVRLVGLPVLVVDRGVVGPDEGPGGEERVQTDPGTSSASAIQSCKT